MTRTLALLLLPVALTACSAAGGKKNPRWDNLDYMRISRERVPRDNDSYYSLPVTPGCLDDSPDTECH